MFSPSSITDDNAPQQQQQQPGLVGLGPSLSVGGIGGQSAAPSLANLHSNSCGSPSFTKDNINSSDGSLKVVKSGKQVNRWSGLWGSSSKV